MLEEVFLRDLVTTAGLCYVCQNWYFSMVACYSWFLSLDFSNCYSIWSLDDSYSSVVSVDFSGDVCAVAFA